MAESFPRVICGKWTTFNGNSHVVLMGDAAHTAHFSIGSGTKLALEDAIELTNQFKQQRRQPEEIPAVLAAYEDVRRVEVRASRTPRATPWNGSRWSARAMPTRSSRSSSCIRC